MLRFYQEPLMSRDTIERNKQKPSITNYVRVSWGGGLSIRPIDILSSAEGSSSFELDRKIMGVTADPGVKIFIE
jgi:hypothetical protein